MSEQPGRIPRLFALAAPSGGGKTSLIRALLERDTRLRLSVSHTTRSPRPGELDGVHYHFVDEAEFVDLIQRDAFLEHARVFGHRYGTGRAAVERQMKAGHDVLLDIDWQGVRQVRAAFPDCCTVFILPPSLDVLHTRLASRGQDSPQIIARRMGEARSEISHWDEFDFVIINDDFEETLGELQSIIRHGRPDHPVPREKLHSLVAELLQDG